MNLWDETTTMLQLQVLQLDLLDVIAFYNHFLSGVSLLGV